MLNSIVALVYFQLHIHKLHRSITRRAFVSETTNIKSCDPPQAELFVTYLCRWNLKPGPGSQVIETGYPVPKPGNATYHYYRCY